MPNLEFTDREVEYLRELLQKERDYWEDNVSPDYETATAIEALTIWGKLHGTDPEAAALEARRQVDAWVEGKYKSWR